jgi:hypothetical protein
LHHRIDKPQEVVGCRWDDTMPDLPSLYFLTATFRFVASIGARY